MWVRAVLLVLANSLLCKGFSKHPDVPADPVKTSATGNNTSIESTNSVYLECLNPFFPVGNQCLYFVTYANETQGNSRLICQSLGGDLTTIQTATQLKDIIQFINDNGFPMISYWIDGDDIEEEGVWRFASGTLFPMGTPFWKAISNAQEPNDNHSVEDCVILYDLGGLLLNDLDCNRLAAPLCEHAVQEESRIEEPPSSIECPPPFVNIGEVCMAFILWAEGPWLDARQICQSIAGELATVNDIELLRSIYLYLHELEIASHSFWLGGSDRNDEGVWTWLDGQSVPMGQPFWGVVGPSVYEPDGGDAENCLGISAEGYHYFRDHNCELLFNPLCMLPK